jgi:hypothetical protein
VLAVLTAISLKPARRSFYEGESGFYGFCEEYGNWAADFYYRTYDENGFRTPMYSTGQKTKTAAAAYRMGLYREGKLISEKTVTAKARPPLFPEQFCFLAYLKSLRYIKNYYSLKLKKRQADEEIIKKHRELPEITETRNSMCRFICHSRYNSLGKRF